MKKSMKSKVKITEEEKREKIRAAMIKKKDLEKKTLKIVEQLLEPGLSESFLIDVSSSLNQNFYADAVEERSLAGHCGYPLCDNPRPEFSHKGKYHISLRDKKVYDLEERRLFCSNTCFTASNFYKSQLETSPLWLRDTETSQTVTVSIFSSLANNGPAVTGAEMEIGFSDEISRTQTENNLNTHQGLPGSSLQQPEEANRKIGRDDLVKTLSKYNQIEEEKTLSETVSQVLEQWFTIDSFRILYGDDQLKIRLREAGAEVLESSSLGDKSLAEQFQASYRDLCRKLDLMDLLDEKEEVEEGQHLPLPSYEMLRTHCQEENSKMGAFLDGKQSYRKDTVSNVVEKDSEKVQPRLPLIDHHSQMIYRRRLVLDGLDKTFLDILKLLKISSADISNHLKELVDTFNISSRTVVFKPEEWTVLAITMLKLISVKNSAVSSVFSNEETMKYLRLVLLSYELDLSYVDLVIRSVTNDITSLLSKYQVK